ncbi:MAG TPA: hypothetical protein VF832_13420 [Longimicrobiales bacterium]
MVRVRVLVLVTGMLAWGCGSSKENAGGKGSGADAAEGAPAGESAQAAQGSRTSSADGPLAEFEAVSAADVTMYLGVMRIAAERIRSMPAPDRQALVTMREMSGRTMASTKMPTPQEIAAMQRAGELMTMDATVARERGVPSRFSSVQSRVDRFLRPMTGSSGDDDEQMTPERRAWLQDRIRRFKELDGQDAAVLAPHRAELLALEKQVRLALHPESMPE